MGRLGGLAFELESHEIERGASLSGCSERFLACELVQNRKIAVAREVQRRIKARRVFGIPKPACDLLESRPTVRKRGVAGVKNDRKR
jgi:hypothetical protein